MMPPLPPPFPPPLLPPLPPPPSPPAPPGPPPFPPSPPAIPPQPPFPPAPPEMPSPPSPPECLMRCGLGHSTCADLVTLLSCSDLTVLPGPGCAACGDPSLCGCRVYPPPTPPPPPPLDPPSSPAPPVAPTPDGPYDFCTTSLEDLELHIRDAHAHAFEETSCRLAPPSRPAARDRRSSALGVPSLTDDSTVWHTSSRAWPRPTASDVRPAWHAIRQPPQWVRIMYQLLMRRTARGEQHAAAAVAFSDGAGLSGTITFTVAGDIPVSVSALVHCLLPPLPSTASSVSLSPLALKRIQGVSPFAILRCSQSLIGRMQADGPPNWNGE